MAEATGFEPAKLLRLHDFEFYFHYFLLSYTYRPTSEKINGGLNNILSYIPILEYEMV